MTANLLTLNSSKTKFVLIGLPRQLANINTSSYNMIYCTHSARDLGFYRAAWNVDAVLR